MGYDHEGFSRYISTLPEGAARGAVLLIYQLKPKGVVNNWLLARLCMHLMCYYVSGMFICECSCSSKVGSLASLQVLSYL